MKQIESVQDMESIKHADKVFMLAQNCFDRVAALAIPNKNAPNKEAATPEIIEPTRHRSDIPSPSGTVALNKNNLQAIAKPISPSPSPLPSPNLSHSQSLQFDFDKDEAPPDPFLLAAQAKNKALLQTYKIKMEQVDPQIRSEMKIRLHRLMQENIDIAKAKREELDKKVSEEKISKGVEKEKHRKLVEKRRQLGRVVSKLHLSKPISQVVENLTQKLKEFGDSAVDEEFRKTIKDSGGNPDIIYKAALKLLRIYNHPFGQHLIQYVISFKQQYQEASSAPNNDASSQLQTLILDTHDFLATLYEKILERYTFLNNENSVYVRMAVEDEVFSSTAQSTLELFENKYRQQDEVLFSKLSSLQDLTPQDLKINPKFCLDPSPDDSPDLKSSMPYSSAISMLKKLTMASTPTQKAGCTARVTKEITACVHSYWEARGVDVTGDKYAIGADDLLPILCYILIKANPPCLKSQSAFMNEFINESLAMGEEGYALATLETVLDFIETFGGKKS